MTPTSYKDWHNPIETFQLQSAITYEMVKIYSQLNLCQPVQYHTISVVPNSKYNGEMALKLQMFRHPLGQLHEIGHTELLRAGRKETMLLTAEITEHRFQ